MFLNGIFSQNVKRIKGWYFVQCGTWNTNIVFSSSFPNLVNPNLQNPIPLLSMWVMRLLALSSAYRQIIPLLSKKILRKWESLVGLTKANNWKHIHGYQKKIWFHYFVWVDPSRFLCVSIFASKILSCLVAVRKIEPLSQSNRTLNQNSESH